eukprot:GHVS01008804.1.p1 GENE.GHVS01008804.1~~GHVS01008804.1.p1  ORF type:complete len:779 (+),score=83.17 GHVS01008804.1:26-2362(+)
MSCAKDRCTAGLSGAVWATVVKVVEVVKKKCMHTERKEGEITRWVVEEKNHAVPVCRLFRMGLRAPPRGTFPEEAPPRPPEESTAEAAILHSIMVEQHLVKWIRAVECKEREGTRWAVEEQLTAEYMNITASSMYGQISDEIKQQGKTTWVRLMGQRSSCGCSQFLRVLRNSFLSGTTACSLCLSSASSSHASSSSCSCCIPIVLHANFISLIRSPCNALPKNRYAGHLFTLLRTVPRDCPCVLSASLNTRIVTLVEAVRASGVLTQRNKANLEFIYAELLARPVELLPPAEANEATEQTRYPESQNTSQDVTMVNNASTWYDSSAQADTAANSVRNRRRRCHLRHVNTDGRGNADGLNASTVELPLLNLAGEDTLRRNNKPKDAKQLATRYMCSKTCSLHGHMSDAVRLQAATTWAMLRLCETSKQRSRQLTFHIFSLRKSFLHPTTAGMNNVPSSPCSSSVSLSPCSSASPSWNRPPALSVCSPSSSCSIPDFCFADFTTLILSSASAPRGFDYRWPLFGALIGLPRSCPFVLSAALKSKIFFLITAFRESVVLSKAEKRILKGIYAQLLRRPMQEPEEEKEETKGTEHRTEQEAKNLTSSADTSHSELVEAASHPWAAQTDLSPIDLRESHLSLADLDSLPAPTFVAPIRLDTASRKTIQFHHLHSVSTDWTSSHTSLSGRKVRLVEQSGRMNEAGIMINSSRDGDDLKHTASDVSVFNNRNLNRNIGMPPSGSAPVYINNARSQDINNYPYLYFNLHFLHSIPSPTFAAPSRLA